MSSQGKTFSEVVIFSETFLTGSFLEFFTIFLGCLVVFLAGNFFWFALVSLFLGLAVFFVALITFAALTPLTGVVAFLVLLVGRFLLTGFFLLAVC